MPWGRRWSGAPSLTERSLQAGISHKPKLFGAVTCSWETILRQSLARRWQFFPSLLLNRGQSRSAVIPRGIETLVNRCVLSALSHWCLCPCPPTVEPPPRPLQGARQLWSPSSAPVSISFLASSPWKVIFAVASSGWVDPDLHPDQLSLFIYSSAAVLASSVSFWLFFNFQRILLG